MINKVQFIDVNEEDFYETKSLKIQVHLTFFSCNKLVLVRIVIDIKYEDKKRGNEERKRVKSLAMTQRRRRLGELCREIFFFCFAQAISFL